TELVFVFPWTAFTSNPKSFDDLRRELTEESDRATNSISVNCLQYRVLLDVARWIYIKCKTRGDRKAALLRVIPGAAVVLHLILPPAHDHQRLANILRGDRNFGSADDVDGVPPAAAEFDDPAAVIEALSEQLADAESGAGTQGGS